MRRLIRTHLRRVRSPHRVRQVRRQDIRRRLSHGRRNQRRAQGHRLPHQRHRHGRSAQPRVRRGTRQARTQTPLDRGGTSHDPGGTLQVHGQLHG